MRLTIFHSSYSPKLPVFLSSTSLSYAPPSRQLRIISCLSIDQTNNASTASSAAAQDTLRVVFAAGGTGGHIYPAVAIADELKTLNPGAEILFVGTPTGMESAAIPSAGYPFTAIQATALARPILSLRNLIIPFVLAKSIYKSLQTLKEFEPQIVVGTGGYVSFPICLAAVLKGLKLVIQEQNSVPGVANSVLSLLAEKIFVAFDSSVECFWRKDKCVVSGNPVRSSLRTYVSKPEARLQFFPRVEWEEKGEMKVLLVLGGSLGANTINVELFHLYRQILSEQKDLFIIWQTGVESFDEMESLVRNHPRLVLTPFLHSLDLAYAAADLVVSRAGAMTCSEILATGKPCILIPSPNAAEGHQFRNAHLMANLAGSRIITEDELDSITLRKAIEEILYDEKLIMEMSMLALKAAKPNAASEIAQQILSLVSLSTTKR